MLTWGVHGQRHWLHESTETGAREALGSDPVVGELIGTELDLCRV